MSWWGMSTGNTAEQTVPTCIQFIMRGECMKIREKRLRTREF